MIIVDLVKYREIGGVDTVSVLNGNKEDSYAVANQGNLISKISNETLSEEILRGTCFRHPNTGEEIYVSFTSNATDVLGLSYEVFANQEEKISDLTEVVEMAKVDLEYLNSSLEDSELNFIELYSLVNKLTLWDRIKLLFNKKHIDKLWRK